MNKYSYFIIGMPEAGKTTFLAALWYCLTNSNKNRLRFKKSNTNLNYLSKICEDWAQVKTIPRTKQGFEELDITLVLEDDNRKEIELTFPDLSGETFQSQYNNREMTSELAKYIISSSEIILFINPMTVNETNLIAEIPRQIRGDKENSNIQNNEVNTRVPLQVELVELLQFIKYIRNKLPIKLEVLVSAWDVIEDDVNTKELKPEEYIREHLPLLWQYIVANAEFYDGVFFGISAQGGFLKNRDKLLEIEDPCDRVFIIDNYGKRSGDITLPLCRIAGDICER
ncbi:TRAFAC clade GTPase domain-containing protein [Clostridium botulinum]|uniref:TRAFAC clade GTPase domain-containing protein n=1 Tax=Clostridium botulinum TaxID=1491 RepID=UPI0013F119DA|nr:AAA family ATPase [Clostridium botulinum]MBN1063621.1 hypothetical protein [Clostridium botulinum]MBY6949431.1 AAA family ATPase [Clostridium botulinum]MBY7023074.1 AAA family ATPase [Clostridium botulinum]NFF23864.1 hypothetical protein [Clostridium botulinum]NFF35967.1 hypothetical protein [Clostridium botulinum]